MPLGRLLVLYRRACEKLSNGGWRAEPLAALWGRQLCDELCERGRLADCLRVESETGKPWDYDGQDATGSKEAGSNAANVALAHSGGNWERDG